MNISEASEPSNMPWDVSPEHCRSSVFRMLTRTEATNNGRPSRSADTRALLAAWQKMMRDGALVVLYDPNLAPDPAGTHPDDWTSCEGKGGFALVKRRLSDPVRRAGKPIFVTYRDRHGRRRTLEEISS